MWHVIPIGGDAISLIAEVYRYFDENESIKSLNARYLFIDSDPSVLDDFLEGIPDYHILQAEKQKDITDSPQNWVTVDEAFDKEYDILRRKFFEHFVKNSDIKSVSGILFVANIGGGTGSNGLIKLLAFFDRWREQESLNEEFALYLNPENVPRYALIIFPKTRKVGMKPQLKNNARQSYQTLRRLKEGGNISGLVYFDRDIIGLTEEEFDSGFKTVMINLVLHEKNIADKELLSSCLAISHNRFDVNWGMRGQIKVLNYKDDGKYYTSDKEGFKIKRAVDLADYGQTLRKKRLLMTPLVSLHPKKKYKLSGRISLDQAEFKRRYGTNLSIESIDFLKSIYHNVIDNINFIHDLGGYEPYEELNLKDAKFTPEKRIEVEVKYKLDIDTQQLVRTNLAKGAYLDKGVYELSSKAVEEIDLYVFPKANLQMVPEFEYLRIRERGAENLLTLKLKKAGEGATLTRDKYQISFRDRDELAQILALLDFDADTTKTAVEIKKRREIVHLGFLQETQEEKGKLQREFILNFDVVEKVGVFIELQCHAEEEEAGEYEDLVRHLATNIFGIPEGTEQPLSYLKLMQQKSTEDNNESGN